MSFLLSPPSSKAPSTPQSSSKSKPSRNATPSSRIYKSQNTNPSTSTTQPSPSPPTKPLLPRPRKCLQCTLLSLPCSLSTASHSDLLHSPPTPETQPMLCTRCFATCEDFCILQIPLLSTEASSEHGNSHDAEDGEDKLGKGKRRMEYFAPCVDPEVVRRRVQELLAGAMEGRDFAPREDQTDEGEEQEDVAETAQVQKFEYIKEIRGEGMEVQELMAKKERDIELEKKKKKKIELEGERRKQKTKKGKKKMRDLSEFETY